MSLENLAIELRDRFAPHALIDGAGLDSYHKATSGHERSIPLVVRPTTVEEVQTLVLAARRHNTPLYPISSGKNWGLGSRLPVTSGNVVVDLGAMDEIGPVDERYGVVMVRPGVTQAQLAAHLAKTGSRFFLDVTGSGADTSVVGNTLERGVAYNTLRAEQVVSVEVVLGTGEVIKTGFAHFPESKIGPLCRFGIGPDLGGLFLQSNLGIVVGLTIKLLPRPAAQAMFLVSLSAADLPAFFEAMRDLVQEGSLDSIVHVGNRRRSEITLTPLIYRQLVAAGLPASRAAAQAIADKQMRGQWSAIGVVAGTPGHVAQSQRRVRARLGRFGRVRFMTPARLDLAKRVSRLPGLGGLRMFLLGVEPLLRLPTGVPTSEALHSVYWPSVDRSDYADNPDLGAGGIAFSAPVIPLDGPTIRAAVEATDRVGASFGFTPAVTLNLMNDRTLEGVVSIDFSRADSARRQQAKECLRALNRAYFDLGCTPYRIDIDNMDLVLRPDDPFWTTVRSLKQALDPDGIIAPGRYSL
ncbi:4-cresol dehydrogenase [Aliidongia dinghuensis]|uniref:4-cresol dehydrogenase n=1 Tax=Aliidongia dinghuensis TaxID=1867774 RepID=A0A8J3E2I7_9PROT|nr:FAD-binding oxidoreductase [Aliidongia dinghuensis]GGF10619.1 4-cresol dehydrogenase [Aliidongia dinghuensis]